MALTVVIAVLNVHCMNVLVKCSHKFCHKSVLLAASARQPADKIIILD